MREKGRWLWDARTAQGHKLKVGSEVSYDVVVVVTKYCCVVPGIHITHLRSINIRKQPTSLTVTTPPTVTDSGDNNNHSGSDSNNSDTCAIFSSSRNKQTHSLTIITNLGTFPFMFACLFVDHLPLHSVGHCGRAAVGERPQRYLLTDTTTTAITAITATASQGTVLWLGCCTLQQSER